ncbi:hypothetical protein COW53_00200 [bacterium CG17_big_fil_post_rev_8_21_14_2_50_64_8]|nr:MAG: hypothetical protein COW53_00200 [bacterium CG17_big_fil_post_rev_8_21_14_2_50_64_8]PJA73740.1 MAG: hypothetical protein CO151_12565 [bacterium CG_4_9_14_3_um_filter_65_15]
MTENPCGANLEIQPLTENLTPAEHALHNNFRISIKNLRKDLVRTASYLLQVEERNIHRKLGFRGLAAYAAEYAGLTRNQTREFLAIGRQLPRFPEVEHALASGNLSWSQARLITRRADPRDQKRWIEQAQSLSVRQLKAAMPHAHAPARPSAEPPPVERAEAGRAQAPTPVPLPGAKKQYLTLAFTPEQYARVMRLLEGAAGADKEEKVLRALASTGGKGAALPHLLVILNCPACGRATIPTNRGEIPADTALLKAAHCDAIIEDAGARRRHSIPPRLRRLALQRARYRCEAEGCGHAQFLEVHHRVPAAAGGSNDLQNLVVLCSRCHRSLHAQEDTARMALRHAPG